MILKKFLLITMFPLTHFGARQLIYREEHYPSSRAEGTPENAQDRSLASAQAQASRTASHSPLRRDRLFWPRWQRRDEGVVGRSPRRYAKTVLFNIFKNSYQNLVNNVTGSSCPFAGKLWFRTSW